VNVTFTAGDGQAGDDPGHVVGPRPASRDRGPSDTIVIIPRPTTRSGASPPSLSLARAQAGHPLHREPLFGYTGTLTATIADART